MVSSCFSLQVLQKWVGQLLKAAVHVHGDQIVHKYEFICFLLNMIPIIVVFFSLVLFTFVHDLDIAILDNLKGSFSSKNFYCYSNFQK